jgi:hypothetical protein
VISTGTGARVASAASAKRRSSISTTSRTRAASDSGSKPRWKLVLTTLADYGSIFGALATVVILLSYLYFASAAFLTGTQLHALVRERVENGAVSRG